MMGLKKLFFIISLVFFICSRGEAETNEVDFNKIFRLVEEDYSLGKKIMERLQYKVYKKQFLRKGDSLKYILQGSDGNLYLFKTYQKYEDENVPNSVFGTKFSAFCGISTPDCYELLLPVNGQLVYGSIQKIIPDLKPFDYGKIPLDKNWLKYYLFRWLLDDPAPDYFLLPDGKIINIDLDKMRDTAGRDFKSYHAGRFDNIAKLYLENGMFQELFLEGMTFIEYLQAIPEEQINTLLGPCGFNERIVAFHSRRRNLGHKFMEYCMNTGRAAGITLAVDNQYGDKSVDARKVLNELKAKVRSKKQALNRLSKEPVLQNNLGLISSPAGVTCLDLSAVPFKDLELLIQQRIEEIKLLRKETANINERLALSFYLSMYRQILSLCRYGVVPSMMTQFIFHPDEIGIKTIMANLIMGNSACEKEEINSLTAVLNNLSLWDIVDSVETNAGLKDIDEGWKQLMVGNCYLGELELGKAIDSFTEIIKLKKANRQMIFLAHLLLGYSYELNADGIRFGNGWFTEKAAAEFRRALEIYPGSSLAKNNLEIINWLINTGTDIDPNSRLLDGEGYYALALFSTIKKEYISANRYIEKAAALKYDQELLADLRSDLGYLQNGN